MVQGRGVRRWQRDPRREDINGAGYRHGGILEAPHEVFMNGAEAALGTFFFAWSHVSEA